MTTSLYIHIPFCAAKCSYCSFNSYSGLEGLHERYVDSLCAEMARCSPVAQLEPLKTVFLGGGTPTLLSGHLLRKILTACSSHFSIAPGAEISIEANPGTVDADKFSLLLDCGVTRLSLGVQSFIDQELKDIGRIHSADEAARAVATAREVGFENVSLDLMYGLPQQSPESWRYSLETALSMAPQHLSLYQLTVEEGTPMVDMLQSGRRELPDDDEIAAMDGITAQLTAAAGLLHYEISNYARPGKQCQHNITYWQNDDYFGVGAGAVSCLLGSRRHNAAIPEEYCRLMENGQTVVIEEETLEQDASFRETVIMGLRMNQGVSLERLRKRYGIQLEQYYGTILHKLLRENLLEQSEGYLRLTEEGRVFANWVMAELV
jgi:putative oxygen-independent coproporphyrinogen III oxidase